MTDWRVLLTGSIILWLIAMVFAVTRPNAPATAVQVYLVGAVILLTLTLSALLGAKP